MVIYFLIELESEATILEKQMLKILISSSLED